MRTSTHLVAAGALLAASGLMLGLEVPPAHAGSGTSSSTGPITIPAGAPTTTSGPAGPYPSGMAVTTPPGLITDVNVTVNDLGHTFPDDLDILVVAPSGESVVLASDACGGVAVEDVDWTWDDEAAASMPDTTAVACGSGSYRPSNYGSAADTWPVTLPGAPGTVLSHLDGGNPLGSWRLYIYDDNTGDVGDVEAGWSLTITTGPVSVAVPGDGEFGVADPYPRSVYVYSSDIITDLDAQFESFTHAWPDDVDALLVGPTGATVMLMSDACNGNPVIAHHWIWDDEAAGPMPDAAACDGLAYRPADYDPQSLPAPAPPSPYGSSLSVFDGTPVAGLWSFYLYDHSASDAGFLSSTPSFIWFGRPPAATRFAAAGTAAPEGSAGSLTISRSATSGTLGPATVQVTSAAGSASVADFTGPHQLLSFAAGEVSRTVPYSITDDTATEGAETFSITLGATTGDAQAADPMTVTVTIPASDPAAPAPPETSLVKGPKHRTTGRTATIRFVSTSATATFECTVDGRGWKPCTSPLKLTRLKVGKHVVQIRAIDAYGTDVTPLVVTWKVVRKR